MRVADARVLYANHSFVLRVNRARLAALAPRVGHLTGLAPANWRHESGGMEPAEPMAPAAAYDLELLRRLGPPRPARFAYPPHGVLQVMQASRADLLHVEQEPHSPVALELCGLWAFRRRPVVMSIHENRPGKLPRALLRAAVAVADRADAVIFVSAEVESGWAPHLSPRRHFRISQGVDLSLFTPDQRQGLGAEEGLRIGYFGRLTAEKGVSTLLRAMARLDPAHTLQVTDFGPGRAEVEAEVRTLGLTDRVTFISVRHAEVPAAMRPLDVVVVPSESTPRWAEQFGRVLVEAMAAGVPVIGTASGSIPEVVGDAGLIVPERDPDALAAAVQRLRDESGLWTELRRRGLARAPRFSWDEVARRIAAVYAEVLGEG